ncbi:Uncharacterised protein [Corynebacterium minutissimum]|uniref:Uncharacterized protein n=1 Tax=Corynebacterium minutissimum TaxID=38301 RepID=A0A2X4RE20_9CORY|nr:hypothetical protein NX84_05875 [Corynebacterium minutissimum]SQI00251.1 Uncharacterised protein [Corynebacterium minutissimum]VEG05682.1 Uncharacterised protein [Corynebacterium minutissimum]
MLLFSQPRERQRWWLPFGWWLPFWYYLPFALTETKILAEWAFPVSAKGVVGEGPRLSRSPEKHKDPATGRW